MKLLGRNIRAMIDSGAQSNFISPNLVNQMKIHWKKKDEPYRLKTVEGEYVAYGQGSVNLETAPLQVDIAGKPHNITLDIIEILKHDVILEIPWL